MPNHTSAERCLVLAFAVVLLGAVPTSAQGQSALDSPPDLTKTIEFERTGEYYLGPTGAKGWMYVNEHFMTDEARQILITNVRERSPADGVLQVGDVILGAGDACFDSDARKRFGRAIDEAEKEQNQGILKLIRWRPVPDAPTRQGKEQAVEIPLRVMGTYSDTAPQNCPKTKKILDDALQVLVAREDWSIFGIKALAFLATGRQKYIKLVRDFLHEAKWARPDFQMSVESGGLVAWGAGYRNLVLAEYYLATGDKYVLPAIREHAVKTAMGQSNGGVWGHGFAWTSQNDGRLHGRLGGYGAVNQAGLPCFLALLLSKKCGIEHPEIDDAIERSRRFFKQFVGKGSIGYGFHRPSLEIHCNGRNGMSGNGKNAIAAVAFGLLADRPPVPPAARDAVPPAARDAVQFFSKMTVSLHNTCEYGHSGNSYSYFWDPLGANYSGPAAAAAFHKQLRWYYALTRQADGSFVNQPLGGHYGRGTLDATVAQVLMMTSPRRAIYLTGKGQDKRFWLDAEEVSEAVEAGRWRLADTDDVSADELIDRLDNWSPIAREWIAMALAEKQGDFAGRLLALFKSDEPEARAGACAALGYLGQRAADAVPAVSEALTDKDPIVRIAAGYALARMKKPARKAVPNMLRAILAEREEGLMRPTQQALSYSLGYAPGKYAPLYFSGVLPNLAEDGNPLQGVDRKLLHASVTKLLKDPSGRVRGCGAYTLKFFTREDLAAMAGPIYDAVKTPAPNYAMFDDDPRQHGLDLMARLRIEEGISLCFETLEPNRWGQGVRLPHRFRTLQEYGAAARSMLPRLKELRPTVKSGENRQFLEDAIQAIEADENPQPVVSLHALVDERLARDLLPATDDRQRARRCRELINANADDYFYQAAGLRQLVSIRGASAWDDILAAVGDADAELRKTAVRLGAQLPGEDVTRKWIGQLSKAQGEKAAGVLEILARRGDPRTLRVIKKYLAHKDTVVRVAAIRAVATLGGQTELPLLIESLVALQTKDDGPPTAAEEAIVAAFRRADHVDRAAAVVLAALPGATPEARCALIRVLGQLGGAGALAAVTAATGDEDTGVSQAALDALGTSPDPRATGALLALIAEPPAPKLKTPALMACLRRVVTGRVPPEQKTGMLEKLLALDGRGRSASAALAELPWSPSIASLKLAQSYLDRQGLTDTAASAAVAIAQKLDINDPKQRKAAVEVLKQVLDVAKNENTIADAKAWITQATAQDSEPSANLLPNPSFEENEADSVRGWTSRAWRGEENGRWTVTSPGRTGKQCLSIHSERGTDAAWSTTVTVKPNSFYRLSGWIKTKDVKGAVGALLNIQNMQHVRTTGVKGTADWTRVSTVFRTAEATELEINCLFGGWGQSTGRAWYDDVSLETIAEVSEKAEAIVTIDTDAPSAAYSPLLFGGFIEHFHRQIYGGLFEPGSPLSDENGFRRDVIEALRQLKLSIVRWPGGCFASGYHWKNGVGGSRQPTFDVVWGVEDPNTFGTDEFLQWCRLVGCEPYICTNAGNGTPQEMRDWVEYCNGTKGRYAQMRKKNGHAEPLGVRFWSIGNENWGGHEIGRKTPKQWGPLVRRSADLMLAADADLTLLAAATPNRDWTLPLLRAAGKHLDYVAIHQYWLPCWRRNLTPDYVSCIMLSDGPEKTITQVIDVIQEAGYRGRIKIAFDEWNLRGWHHPGFPRKQAPDPSDPAVRELIEKRDINADASQYSMADALFAASFLNACLRHAEDVGMANVAPVVNTRGPLYVHRHGIVRRTTFHTLAMYANLLEARVGRLDLEAGMLVQGKRFLPVLDAVATVDESGRTWAIALVNRHPSRHVACTVKMKDAPVEGTCEAKILAGDSPDAYNDVEHPDRVVPEKTQLTFERGVVRLPPHSLTIVRVARAARSDFSNRN